MKKVKRLFLFDVVAMLLVLSITLSVGAAAAVFDNIITVETFATSGEWTYNVSGDNATITGYSGSDTIVTIPAEIDGYTVTSIQGSSSSGGKSVFSSPAVITEIIIPEGITNISVYAFARCTALTSVTIPDGVTAIGQYAFYNCIVLEEINLPNSLNSIGNSAFAGCRTITSLTIPNGVTSIGDRAFDACISLVTISEIPSSVSSIGEGAFYQLELSEITVSGDNEYYCADGGVLFNKDKTTLLVYPSKKADSEYAVPETVKTIYASAFNRCENLVTVTIPASVTNIGSRNFVRSLKLENISVSEKNENYIDLYGVLYNKSLKSILIYPSNNSQTEIIIPSTVTQISDHAFYYTHNLKSVTIPISVTNIGSYSLHECEGLTDIYYEGSQTQWNSLLYRLEAYNNAVSSATMHYDVVIEPTPNPDDWTYTVSGGNATVTAYNGTDTAVAVPSEISGYPVVNVGASNARASIFSDTGSVTSVIIPDGVTNINRYAFSACTNLTSVKIPNGVVKIDLRAFYQCSSLKDIELPDGLTTIGDRAFYGCNALTAFSIPASVTSITSPAISGTNLREISVDEGNTAYASVDGVLYNKSITNLIAYPNAKERAEYRIPDTVKTVDGYAIITTYNLQDIYIPSSVIALNNPNNFYQCKALENFHVDENNTVYTDIDGTLYNKAGTKLLSHPARSPLIDVVIPETVTSIERSALYYIGNMKTITIPASITSTSMVGAFAYECENITDIYYGGSSAEWAALWGSSDYTTRFPNAVMHYVDANYDTVELSIKNFYSSRGEVYIAVGSNTALGAPFTVVAAKYKGDDLIDAVIDNCVTNVVGGRNQYVTLSKKLTADSEGEYVKIMLWKNTDTCQPLCEPYVGDAKVEAFPGAEGAGKYSKGARNSSNIEVYHVTNLNDSGAGSFRDAVSESGRIVVFDVGGTINLTKSVNISGGTTILGQTAPSDGITLAGANVSVSSSDNIIRYLRIRPTAVNGLECDSFGGTATDSIIDHCSASYSVDECLTFYGGRNLTVQNCISSESLKNSIHSKGAHGYGGIWGGNNASYHHNLMATHDSRTPRLDRQLQGTDVRNNIIYNWGNTNSAYGGESVSTDGSYNGLDTKVNWVNNYYKAGPSTASKLLTRLFDTSSPKEHPSYFYFSGNVLEGNANVTNDNTKGVNINSDKGMVFLDEPVEMEINIPEETATQTYNTLLSHVGASLPKRDETDARVINDVINGTGRVIDDASEVGGVMQYEPTYRVFEIPQEWKDENGMGDAAETDIVADGKWLGYTWIEAYVNDWTEQQSNPTNPTVTVKSDKTSAAVQGTVNVTASAAAQSGTEIVKIDIYDNDVLVSTHTGANATASVQLRTAGKHYISAVAYNDKGEGTRSTPIAVTVTE